MVWLRKDEEHARGDQETTNPGLLHESEIDTPAPKLPNLPPEILALICEYVCPNSPNADTATLETFQLVCKRFRDVVINLPHLWAYVDDRMDVERIDLQLSRCGNVGVSVRIFYTNHFKFFEDIPCKCSQWVLMKTSCARWIHADISIEAGRIPPEPPFQHRCVKSLHELGLTSLESMVVDIRMMSDYNRDSFRWTMPQLQSVVCKSSSALELPFTAPLKHVVFKSATSEALSQSSVLEFVRKPFVESVTDLTFDFSPLSGLRFRFSSPDDTYCTTLEKVETFTVDLGHQNNFDRVDSVFLMEHFRLPNVKVANLRFCGTLALYICFWEWLKMLASSSPSLTRVHITFVDRSIHLHNSTHERILECFASPRPGAQDDSRPSPGVSCDYSERLSDVEVFVYFESTT